MVADISAAMAELANALEASIQPGGADRVKLPSGAILEGEGATVFIDLVRAVAGLARELVCATRDESVQ